MLRMETACLHSYILKVETEGTNGRYCRGSSCNIALFTGYPEIALYDGSFTYNEHAVLGWYDEATYNGFTEISNLS